MLNVTLQFETFQPHYDRGKSLWTLTKTFNDESHLKNFISYIKKTKGYMLDEIYYNNN